MDDDRIDVYGEFIVKNCLKTVFQDRLFKGTFWDFIANASLNTVNMLHPPTSVLSPAMLTKRGGIDFNSNNLNLQVQNSGNGINFQILPALSWVKIKLPAVK
jgi:hypothetical protein